MLLSNLDPERRLAELERAGTATASGEAPRYSFLTAQGQSATPLEQEALLGTNNLVEMSFLDRCRVVRECIGRIRVQAEGRRGWATGFLIAPGLLLTNQHVFPNGEAVGASRVEFGYWYDVAGQLPRGTEEFALDPASFFVADEELDFAVVAVSARSATGSDIAGRGHLRLIRQTGKVKKGEFVTILQHPDGDPMRIALRENEVTRVEDGESVIWYAADTAHGSSGAPVFNDSLQLVALHASGRIQRDSRGQYARRDGTWAESLEGLSEGDVIWEANVGVRVSRICESLLTLARQRFPTRVTTIEAAMDGGDVLGRTVARLKDPVAAFQPATAPTPEETEAMADRTTQPGAGMIGTALGNDGGGVVVPLRLRVTLEPGAIAVSPAMSPEPSRAALPVLRIEEEAFELRTPVVYDGLEERKGFDSHFLELPGGKSVPVPKVTAAGRKVLAPLLDGSGAELKYRHFSVWMHRERRLALFTAANVDWRKRRKTVEGKSTARKALAGFPPESNFAELWVDDPRIDARHQLPDAFYSEDRGAFDKGHIVRRDDVCWGSTYEEIQMANGDTFHVTNCSPQVKPFNQGAHGEENWGDLEDYIEKATKQDAEKACVFAGPIFGPDDRWFRGKDEAGPARIQIPRRFWKLVVVAGEGGPAAYGFLLEQDVRSITEKEFYVTDEWLGALKPIGEIASLLRGWLDLSAVEACDQHGAVVGS
ncbi:DNA/RNA non-specific endonuclease [Paracraurococcus ruber]|nr:DNA/RNA non-specific endonuclease [Paracraurococcus ruber]